MHDFHIFPKHFLFHLVLCFDSSKYTPQILRLKDDIRASGPRPAPPALIFSQITDTFYEDPQPNFLGGRSCFDLTRSQIRPKEPTNSSFEVENRAGGPRTAPPGEIFGHVI